MPARRSVGAVGSVGDEPIKKRRCQPESDAERIARVCNDQQRLHPRLAWVSSGKKDEFRVHIAQTFPKHDTEAARMKILFEGVHNPSTPMPKSISELIDGSRLCIHLSKLTKAITVEEGKHYVRQLVSGVNPKKKEQYAQELLSFIISKPDMAAVFHADGGPVAEAFKAAVDEYFLCNVVPGSYFSDTHFSKNIQEAMKYCSGQEQREVSEVMMLAQKCKLPENIKTHLQEMKNQAAKHRYVHLIFKDKIGEQEKKRDEAILLQTAKEAYTMETIRQKGSSHNVFIATEKINASSRKIAAIAQYDTNYSQPLVNQLRGTVTYGTKAEKIEAVFNNALLCAFPNCLVKGWWETYLEKVTHELLQIAAKVKAVPPSEALDKINLDVTVPSSFKDPTEQPPAAVENEINNYNTSFRSAASMSLGNHYPGITLEMIAARLPSAYEKLKLKGMLHALDSALVSFCAACLKCYSEYRTDPSKTTRLVDFLERVRLFGAPVPILNDARTAILINEGLVDHHGDSRMLNTEGGEHRDYDSYDKPNADIILALYDTAQKTFLNGLKASTYRTIAKELTAISQDDHAKAERFLKKLSGKLWLLSASDRNVVEVVKKSILRKKQDNLAEGQGEPQGGPAAAEGSVLGNYLAGLLN